jgi:hypothetical protein
VTKQLGLEGALQHGVQERLPAPVEAVDDRTADVLCVHMNDPPAVILNCAEDVATGEAQVPAS